MLCILPAILLLIIYRKIIFNNKAEKIFRLHIYLGSYDAKTEVSYYLI